VDIAVIDLIRAGEAKGRAEAEAELDKLRELVRLHEVYSAGCQRREAEARYAAHTRLPVVVGEPYPVDPLLEELP
jgi:hypothetical protein